MHYLEVYMILEVEIVLVFGFDGVPRGLEMNVQLFGLTLLLNLLYVFNL